MNTETRRLGALLDRLVEGTITSRECEALVAQLEQVEHDPDQPTGIRIAALAILAAIHSRLLHA